MSAESTGPSLQAELVLNTELIDQVQHHAGIELSASLYAAPLAYRLALARLLAKQNIWVHTDVFADQRTGNGLELLEVLAARDGGLIDVHLLTAGALGMLGQVCRANVTRVTFPFEGVPDIRSVVAQIRAVGAKPWLAIAPATTLTMCAEALSHVDGLLVMLLEPGSIGQADLSMLAKVRQASAAMPVGVDGGVGENNLAEVLAAGATYIVIGRRLFPFATLPNQKEAEQGI